jgi:zinc protease
MPPRQLAAAAFLLLAILLLAAPLPAFGATARDVSSFTLDNGLQVVVIPDHRAPVVNHTVWYKVGSVDDPPGRSGIAHFLEHLMFKGTTDHPSGEFSVRIRAVGGDDNASTRPDATEYHQSVAKQHLGLMMEFEADRMADLIISEDGVETEREVVREERRSRVDNAPGSILSEAVNAALYRNSAYGTPVIGWPHEIAALDRDDARDFYDRYYTPNNAIVVVAGDVTVDEVRALAEATYGQLPRRAEPPQRIRPSEPPLLASVTVRYADERVTEPSVSQVYLVPSMTTAAPGESEAIDILSDILSAGATSRIYRSLVVDKAVATSAGAGYDGTRIGDGVFYLYGVPRGDTTPEELLAELDAVIADLIDNGVTEDELMRAKRRIRAQTVYMQDNVSSLARMYGQALALGHTIGDVDAWPDAIEAVTGDQVVAAARKFLDPDHAVTGYLLGKPAENRS